VVEKGDRLGERPIKKGGKRKREKKCRGRQGSLSLKNEKNSEGARERYKPLMMKERKKFRAEEEGSERLLPRGSQIGCPHKHKKNLGRLKWGTCG